MKPISYKLGSLKIRRLNFHLLIISLLIALFFIKSRNLLLSPFLWAEDANVFLAPILQTHSIFNYGQFEIYNGQYWILNHLLWSLIFVASNGNLFILPFLGGLVSLLLVIGCASLWLRDNLLVKSTTYRIAIFAYVLFSPSSWETLGTIAGVHTYFLVGMIALLGWKRPTTKSWKLAEWCILLICAFISFLIVEETT